MFLLLNIMVLSFRDKDKNILKIKSNIPSSQTIKFSVLLGAIEESNDEIAKMKRNNITHKISIQSGRVSSLPP